MKEKLEKIIGAGLEQYSRKKGFEIPKTFSIDLVVSKSAEHGDFASNLAFKLAKVARGKPSDIASDLQKVIETGSVVDRVEVAGAGFLNFFLAKSSLSEILKRVRSEDQAYGTSEFGEGKKILLEYVSANPTGPLTIAHGRQAAIGDSLSRILTAAGYNVHREYYLNDAGRQMRLLGESVWARMQELQGEKVEFPEEGYQGDYIKDLAKQLYEKDSSLANEKDQAKVIEACKVFACDSMMKRIREDLKAFEVEFDNYFSEKTLYENKEVEESFKDLTQAGHLYEKEGALWFETTKFGDDKDRVVRKSSGEMTYLAPDISYHRNKFKRGHEWLVDFMGPDHHGYIVRLKASCEALGYDADQLDIRIVQLVTLYRNGEPVRMSTRAGEFVTLRELIEEVGKDAARFFFVMRRVESLLDFDLELAKQKSQDNPVYYLQYAHARIAGILRKSEVAIDESVDTSLLKEKEENELIKKISDFPEILTRASTTLEPYRLVDYLRELAAAFHKFYSHHKVLTEDKALSQARLYLCDATRIVMRNGLSLLGISQPDSM